MLEKLLTKNAKVSFEPSLATVALRFTGLSGFGLILALIGFAVLHINFPDLGAYCWAVPLTLWLVGTLLLFVGAVHAFGNAPEKDVKLTTLKVCQIITGVYLGGCVFFLVRGEAGVSLFIASMVEIYFVATTSAFLLIAAFTRTRLPRRVWLDAGLAATAAAVVFKQLFDSIRA
jgi:hypothetical protein